MTKAMKKLSFLLLAALVVATGSCEKNVSMELKAMEATLLFTSERPETEDITKTFFDGDDLLWSKGDAIRIGYTVDSKWQGVSGEATSSSPAKLLPSEALKEDCEIASFKVSSSFTNTSSGAYKFYSVYPSSAFPETMTDAPYADAAIPSEQKALGSTFDPSADLMVGQASAAYNSLPSEEITLKWHRIVAHGDIILKDIAGLTPGETPLSVTLEANRALTGTVPVDITNGGTGSSSNSSTSATIDVSSLSFNGSNIEFWVSILPGKISSLNVTLVTDKATYEREISGLNLEFLRNKHNLLTIDMSSASRTAKKAYYVKVTENLSDWTGDYLIVYDEGATALNGVSSSDIDSANNDVSVTINDSKVEATSDAVKAQFHLEKSGSGYTIFATEGEFYLGNSGKNMKANSTETVYSVEYSSGSTVVSNGSYKLMYNTSWTGFRFYTSGQKEIQLYRLDGSPSSGSDTPSDKFEATVETVGVSSVTQYTATAHASYSGVNTVNKPQNVVINFGTSRSNLNEVAEANESVLSSNGSFTASLTGLSSGTTYYYRASMDAWNPETNQYQHIEGEIKSFTTSVTEVTEGNQRAYPELPMMRTVKSGNYLVSSTDPSQYFAYHICPGGEKDPNGSAARNYTVCFSSEHHCAFWVAAPRHSMYSGSSGRSGYSTDPDIPSSIQYKSKDTGGGCNKGHMLGSAERTSSSATNKQVFYYTNIAPQLSSGFNTGGGGWNLLEDWVDTQVCADTLYEVVGCYFDKYTDAYGYTVSPSTISFGGRSDVSMPTMFYYVLLRTKRGSSGKAVKNCSADELQCAAFVRSHTNSLKGQKVTSREMMSVADLEKITGFTYFANVPNAPKSTFTPSDWGL